MVLIYPLEDGPMVLMHHAHGVGVTINMVIHDVAYACLTHVCEEHTLLQGIPFRYIPVMAR